MKEKTGKEEQRGNAGRIRKRGGLSRVLIRIGILLLACAAGLTLYNYLDSERAAKASEEILAELDRQMGGESGPDGTASGVNGDAAGAGAGADTGGGGADSAAEGTEGHPEDSASDGTEGGAYRDMPVRTADGYAYIGILYIPSLSLRLPVMADWDYTRLKISPCRFSGSYYTDDLVICAHNYARHFSPIKWIRMGVDVYFTTMSGETIHYITTNIQTVQPTRVADMVDNTKNSASSNDWDMTLFTCSTGGRTRCAVRCERTSDGTGRAA